MENKTKPAAPSDEDLGAALRKIAVTLGQDEDGFAYYANRFVDWSTDKSFIAWLGDLRVRNVKLQVRPASRIDVVLENLVEMLVGSPSTVDPPSRSLDSDDVAFLIGLAVTVPDGDGSVPKRLRSIAERIAGG